MRCLSELLSVLLGHMPICRVKAPACRASLQPWQVGLEYHAEPQLPVSVRKQLLDIHGNASPKAAHQACAKERDCSVAGRLQHGGKLQHSG